MFDAIYNYMKSSITTIYGKTPQVFTRDKVVQALMDTVEAS